jgi:ribonucleoside-diphosphate reductase alpha chain
MFSTARDEIAEIARRRGIIQGDETLNDAIERVQRSIVAVDAHLEGQRDPLFDVELAATFETEAAMPGTPILANAGRKARTLGACTVIHVPKSGGGQSLLRLSEAHLGAGVGTGYDLSETDDPLAELVRLNNFLLDYDRQLIEQKRRPVASMVTLNARHPDVLRFINAKTDADFSRWRANLSVVFAGEGVDALLNSLVFPIAEAAHRCGEPGVLFFDRFEADNPTPHIPYLSTAPCAEVALAAGELCHFWYVNLAAMIVESADATRFDWERLHRTVRTVVRALDSAVQMSIDAGAAPVVVAKRRIGVGVTGFHDSLMRLQIPYASMEAESIARQISEQITFAAHSASADLAARRGPFPAWRTSRFTEPVWLARKTAHRTGVVADNDWRQLHRRIETRGIRHASVVAYPPAGVTSELLRTSKSYEPYFTLVGLSQPDDTGHRRKEIPPGVEQALRRLNASEAAKLRSQLLESDGRGILNVPESNLFATARQISADWHLRVHGAFQNFADESGAKTVNVAEDIDLGGMVDLFHAARQLGLKGVSVFRDNCLSGRSIGRTIGVN